MNKLKSLRIGLIATSVLLAGLLSAPTYADAILLSRNVQVTALTPPSSDALGVVSVGKLTMSITDLIFPQALQSLSFAISSGTSVLKSVTGTGTLTFDVVGPMTLFANVFAQPNAAAGSGLYHVDVTFVAAAAPPVPLPAALWLLVSGLAAVVGFKKKAISSTGTHAPVTNSVVQ